MGAVNRRDIVIGLIVLVLLAGLVYWLRRPSTNLTVPETDIEVEESFESSFNVDIPDTAERVVLRDAEGGTFTGLAVRHTDENGSTTYSLLTDLTDLPEAGMHYEGWLTTSSDTERISMGKMRLHKGGYTVDFVSSTILPEHTRVIVTLEPAGEVVLEGAF